MIQLHTTSQIEKALESTSEPDNAVSWQKLINEGIEETRKSLEAPVVKVSKLGQIMSIVFAALAAMFLVTMTYSLLKINGPSFAAYEVGDGHSISKMSESVRSQFQQLQVTAIFSMLIGMPFSVVASIAFLSKHLKQMQAKKERATSLLLPKAIRYAGVIQESETGQGAVVTATRSDENGRIQDLFQAPLDKDPVQAVEQLDALMQKLRDHQEKAYANYFLALQAANLQSTALQEQCFQELENEVEMSLKATASQQGYLQLLREHANHHNKANEEMFETTALTLLADEIPDVADQTATAEQAA